MSKLRGRYVGSGSVYARPIIASHQPTRVYDRRFGTARNIFTLTLKLVRWTKWFIFTWKENVESWMTRRRWRGTAFLGCLTWTAFRCIADIIFAISLINSDRTPFGMLCRADRCADTSFVLPAFGLLFSSKSITDDCGTMLVVLMKIFLTVTNLQSRLRNKIYLCLNILFLAVP